MSCKCGSFLCNNERTSHRQYMKAFPRQKVVPSSLGGFEPPTFRLTAERANQLRHRDLDDVCQPYMANDPIHAGRWAGFFWVGSVDDVAKKYKRYQMKKRKKTKSASAGSRTRIHCLEGNDANRYTTDATYQHFDIKVTPLQASPITLQI